MLVVVPRMQCMPVPVVEVVDVVPVNLCRVTALFTVRMVGRAVFGDALVLVVVVLVESVSVLSMKEVHVVPVLNLLVAALVAMGMLLHSVLGVLFVHVVSLVVMSFDSVGIPMRYRPVTAQGLGGRGRTISFQPMAGSDPRPDLRW